MYSAAFFVGKYHSEHSPPFDEGRAALLGKYRSRRKKEDLWGITASGNDEMQKSCRIKIKAELHLYAKDRRTLCRI